MSVEPTPDTINGVNGLPPVRDPGPADRFLPVDVEDREQVKKLTAAILDAVITERQAEIRHSMAVLGLSTEPVQQALRTLEDAQRQRMIAVDELLTARRVAAGGTEEQP